MSAAVIDRSPDDTATSESATPAVTRSSKSLNDRAKPIPAVPPRFTASVPAIERISLSLSAATFTALTATTPSPLPLCRPSIFASLVPDSRLTETAPAPAMLFLATATAAAMDMIVPSSDPLALVVETVTVSPLPMSESETVACVVRETSLTATDRPIAPLLP